jgi:hypothetical protein
MAKQTIISPVEITGWDCAPTAGGEAFICTPSDEYIRDRAYFRYVVQNPPGSDAYANWITAENDFIAARGNDLTVI